MVIFIKNILKKKGKNKNVGKFTVVSPTLLFALCIELRNVNYWMISQYWVTECQLSNDIAGVKDNK